MEKHHKISPFMWWKRRRKKRERRSEVKQMPSI